jgi:flagellar protein FlaG
MNLINTNSQVSRPELSVQTNKALVDLPSPISNTSDSEAVKKVANTEIKTPDVSFNSEPSRQAVAKAAEQIQTFVKEMGRNLSFSVDETTGYNVVKVVNPDTNEIIRQLPSEELLKIARSMESWNSVLVNQKV